MMKNYLFVMALHGTLAFPFITSVGMIFAGSSFVDSSMLPCTNGRRDPLSTHDHLLAPQNILFEGMFRSGALTLSCIDLDQVIEN
jgi:hypothetical protein